MKRDGSKASIEFEAKMQIRLKTIEISWTEAKSASLFTVAETWSFHFQLQDWKNEVAQRCVRIGRISLKTDTALNEQR